ncbi:hypothetical protein JXQ70_06760 [bacterium]|nr:hypothetical protein [bacterium]
MINLERASAFIRSKGNEVEQARLKYFLSDERPAQEVVAKFCAGQRPDGGWSPFWAKDYSSLDPGSHPGLKVLWTVCETGGLARTRGPSATQNS